MTFPADSVDVVCAASADLLAGMKESFDWDFIDACWDAPEREMQYIACYHLRDAVHLLQPDDLPRLSTLIQTKSWWNSVDSVPPFFGVLLLGHPSVRDDLRLWAHNENLWIRRSVINCQLSAKPRVDTELLAHAIEANVGSAECFVNKAIGSALRDYGRTDPAWVGVFLTDHRGTMAALSLREACKHLAPEYFTR